MGVPYPKTFTKGQPLQSANDNRPGRVYLPANDNVRRGRSMIPQIARAARRMPFKDWRIQAALELAAQLADFGAIDPEAWVPGRDEGLDTTGWDVLENFGRPEHFNVPGVAGNGYAWPNVTQATHYSYPGALVGYTGTPGYYDPGYVTEFQTAADPNATEFSTWAHYDFDGPATAGELENVAGYYYWRVGTAKTYGGRPDGPPRCRNGNRRRIRCTYPVRRRSPFPCRWCGPTRSGRSTRLGTRCAGRWLNPAR